MNKSYYNGSRDDRKVRSLTFDMKKVFRDIVQGTYDKDTKTHDKTTGRPWVQMTYHMMGHIGGYAALDGFDSFAEQFDPVDCTTIQWAIPNECGIFATTRFLHPEELSLSFISHRVRRDTTLDRLGFQLRDLFDLSLFIRWKDDEMETSIVPRCRIRDLRYTAIDKDYDYLSYRIGTEKDLREIQEAGLELDSKRLQQSQVISDDRKVRILSDAVACIDEFVARSFDQGLTWGVKPEGPAESTDDRTFALEMEYQDGETAEEILVLAGS